MNTSRKITIGAASTVAAVLAASGIAMAAPTLSAPASDALPGDLTDEPTGWADWMDEMHADNADWMGQMHAGDWSGADMDVMHASMAETIAAYPQMQQHMGFDAPLGGQGR